MSLPSVILISKPQIDFKNFLFLCKSFLNRSVSAGLDKQNRSVKGSDGFICILDEFSVPGSDPSFALPEAGDLLKHLHYAFLCALEHKDYVTLLEISGLHFTVSETTMLGSVLAVTSGNLSEWRTCIINLSSIRAEGSVRHFANRILETFDLESLGSIFAAYTRSKHRDGTILLLER